MNKLILNKWRGYASLLGIVTFMFARPVLATLTISTANEHGSAPFTPSWTPAAGSLIAGLSPSSISGNFALDDTNRNPDSLTSGDSLTITTDPGNTGPDPIGNTTTSSNYVTCGNGSGAGSTIIYTLPASADGYNLTNITVDGGWGDNGRDGQAYNVFYSTVSNPSDFIYLTSVSYVPSGVPNSTPSATQVILSDSAGGVIAANVAAVKFDFTFPGSENGWTGYGAITVQGTSATSITTPPIVITTANQNGPSPFTPTYSPETNNDLILGLSPSTATGNFQEDGGNNGPISVLTDGLLASNVNTTGWESQFVSCGGGSGAGSTLIYTLPANANGYDITNIVVYNGWQDGGRDGQYYIVSYSTVAAPTTYVPIGTVYYLPSVPAQPSLNRVSISPTTGAPLGSGVQNIKFDFASPTDASGFDNGWQGYDEIIVQGTSTAAPPPPPSPLLTQDILPTYAETVVGDVVVFTADFSNAPPANLQWQSIIGGVTNIIPGATSSTLTLNDVQTSSSGYYQLKAVNATNNAAAPSYSTPAQLVVGSTPSPVDDIVVDYAGQCGWGGAGAVGISTNFTPTWTVDTTNDIILNSVDTFVSGPFPGDPGTVNFSGNFALEGGDLVGDPAVLSDGSFGYFSYWPNVGTSPTECSCGVNGAGSYVIYALNTNGVAPYGFDITNITVYGGWGDSGRNEQKYQVLYSTVAAPTNFSAMITVDYNPNDPNDTQSGTRTTLVPASGVLAHNVYAVEINWDLVGSVPKNGVEGYSEIVIAGTNSAPLATLVQDITPLAAEDVVGSSLTLTAKFNGATSYQWQQNGTNIPGATSSTLTINNLQPSNTATNGGYVLVASNAAGSVMTRGCTVIVDPVPAPVNNVVQSWAYQLSDSATFAPTWPTNMLPSSLIYGQNPPAGGYDPIGDYNDIDSDPLSFGLAGGLVVLTDGNYGSIVPDGPHPAFATCGTGSFLEPSLGYSTNSGEYVVYTLGPSATGYDVTNIQIAGGWNDNGRDSQYYTVSYSTVANPNLFIPLVTVTNNIPNNPNSIFQANDGTMVRGTFTPGTGVLARNVYAIYVDFTSPPNVPNGYSGYSEISVFGEPSASDTLPISVTAANENTATPTWTPETPDLILGQLPSSTGAGSFAGSFNNEAPTEGLSALTDGTLGPFDIADTNFATCGGAFGAGSSVTYASANGWNLTNIVVYSGWGDYNRGGQFYNITYSTLSAPTVFVPLTSVNYNPPFNPPANYVEFNTLVSLSEPSGPQVNRVDIAPANGAVTLATNVYAVTFDFTPQTGGLDNGYSGYSEIILQGSTLAAPTAATFSSPVRSGNSLVLSGKSNAANAGRAYNILSSTNLLTPLSQWTIVGSGDLSGTGTFTNSIPINSSQPTTFFLLQTY